MIVINNHRIEEHREFVLEQLIPLIVGHARNSGSPSEAVTLASFFALATILQAEGMSRSTLLQAIDTARLSEHEASEVLH
ncbi:hypothetical protein KRX52_14900 [Pseudomonas sp. MAP12]|uniref:Uncharacterized protein n=1 Tax=Geopseudomonas aromaticivorans TaxID=2849492 RepID=A0ABS6N0C5_9GAMM|nr:hypothetical protein [Pseudomonas aromaticivorans]MBV2134066.1 hypothetical protein [Pseudomonas aromaticivorans]